MREARGWGGVGWWWGGSTSFFDCKTKHVVRVDADTLWQVGIEVKLQGCTRLFREH